MFFRFNGNCFHRQHKLRKNWLPNSDETPNLYYIRVSSSGQDENFLKLILCTPRLKPQNLRKKTEIEVKSEHLLTNAMAASFSQNPTIIGTLAIEGTN